MIDILKGLRHHAQEKVHLDTVLEVQLGVHQRSYTDFQVELKQYLSEG